MKRHYHVFVSMPGYLPDNEPEIYTSRKRAEAAAKWHADEYRDLIASADYDPDAYEHDWRVTGSARSGRYTVDRGEYTLPIYITIDPCDSRMCESEDNQ